MPSLFRSSRLRYIEYRRRIRRRRPDERVEISPAALMDPKTDTGKKNRPRTRTFLQLLRAFLGMLRGHRKILIFALLTLGLSTLLGLVPLYGSKLVIDNVLGNHPLPRAIPRWIHLPGNKYELLTFIAVAMVVLALLSEVAGLWSRWLATRTTKRVQVAIRTKVFEHAVRLPLHRVYELKSGGVASILREDAGGIGDLVFSLLYNPWRAIVQLTGSLIVLALVDWRLLAGSLLILPVVWLTHRAWIARIRPIHRDIRATRQHIDARATEAFGGMRVVRSFSRQRSESANFGRDSNLMARQEIFSWWWARTIDFAWGVVIPVASALLLYYGGLRILQNKMTVGDLVMFLAYLVALLGPIATLAASATALQTSLAGLDRVLDLLNETEEMPSRPSAIALNRDQVRGRITLENVSFAYPQSQSPVLREIKLDVQPGEMIALVGPSGAGKTTLCNLIARFYDPTSGAILLDGVDLRDITVDSYRRLLGIVEQDTFLFDGTIAENISYGRRGATPQQIEQAARAANAHDFIAAMEKGYNTFIGERGVKLSGGQRQRLTIARAILADPRILILDEATSNLDTESERLIQGSLQTLMAGRTSFVIAHRLSTIIHADRILVIQDGKIIEQGRHEELLNHPNGRYREMVAMQTSPPPSPVVGQTDAAPVTVAPGMDEPLS